MLFWKYWIIITCGKVRNITTVLSFHDYIPDSLPICLGFCRWIVVLSRSYFCYQYRKQLQFWYNVAEKKEICYNALLEYLAVLVLNTSGYWFWKFTECVRPDRESTCRRHVCACSFNTSHKDVNSCLYPCAAVKRSEFLGRFRRLTGGRVAREVTCKLRGTYTLYINMKTNQHDTGFSV